MFGQIVRTVLLVPLQLDEQGILAEKQSGSKENAQHQQGLQTQPQPHQEPEDRGTGERDPSCSGVGEHEPDEEDGKQDGDERSADGGLASRNQQGKNRRNEERQNRPVGRMVLVEWGHHPVSRILVEPISRVADEGVNDHDGQGHGVQQDHVPGRNLAVADEVSQDPKEADDEPNPHQPGLQGNEGQVAHEHGEPHPQQPHCDPPGKGVAHQGGIHGKPGETAEQEEHKDACEHGFGGQIQAQPADFHLFEVDAQGNGEKQQAHVDRHAPNAQGDDRQDRRYRRHSVRLEGKGGGQQGGKSEPSEDRPAVPQDSGPWVHAPARAGLSWSAASRASSAKRREEATETATMSHRMG